MACSARISLALATPSDRFDLKVVNLLCGTKILPNCQDTDLPTIASKETAAEAPLEGLKSVEKFGGLCHRRELKRLLRLDGMLLCGLASRLGSTAPLDCRLAR